MSHRESIDRSLSSADPSSGHPPILKKISEFDSIQLKRIFYVRQCLIVRLFFMTSERLRQWKKWPWACNRMELVGIHKKQWFLPLRMKIIIYIHLIWEMWVTELLRRPLNYSYFQLDSAFQIHVDHVDAVLDVDWSPTGKELVSASYDRTIRIFPQGQNRSREVYHVKRMQRVFSVAFSGDSRLVFCYKCNNFSL